MKLVVMTVQNGYIVYKFRDNVNTARLVFKSKKELMDYLSEAIEDVSAE